MPKNPFRELRRFQDKLATLQSIPSENVTISSTGSSVKSPTSYVLSIRTSSGTQLTGNVMLASSSGIELVQSGQTITIRTSTGVGSVDRYTQSFSNSSEWTVNHNLNNSTPNVTVWQDADVYGFGVQAFGTTPFGGSTGTSRTMSSTGTVTVEDSNTVKVAWGSKQYGAVAVIV